MSASIQTLIEPVQLGASATLLFTAVSPTRVDQMAVANVSTTEASNLTLYWVPAGGTPDAMNTVVPARPVQPSETWNVLPMIGQVLSAGDELHASGSPADDLNLFASGTVS